MEANTVRGIMRNILIASLCSFIATTLGCGNMGSDQAKIQPLTKHWEKPVPYQKVPDGLASLSAEVCGTCHTEIYREWKASFHAIALQDPQFQGEWKRDKELWVCLNCHTPLENQQEFIILGKEDGDYFKPVKKANPNFDAELQQESITCAVCHVRDGAVIGTLGNQATSPHKVKADPEFLSRQFCLTCHNVTEELTPSLVCSFQTGEEWKSGPYPQAGRDCITCHMPEVYRSLTTYTPARWTRRHTWIGSAIPKFMGGEKIVSGYKRGTDIDVHYSQKKVADGDSIFVTVSIVNQHAGHYLPTGDPEYFITLDLSVRNGENKVLADTTHRIGQIWKWWPEAEKLSDNRLRPLEKRDYSFTFLVPKDAVGNTFKAVVTNHRLTPENANATGLLGISPLNAVVFEKEISFPKQD
jgi:hypothetical protein